MTPSPRALVGLLALSALSALLAVWQWMELLIVRGGGAATCSFSSTVDCAQVWDSDFAGRVHNLLGVPVAGLGLQWAVTAFALCLWLTYQTVQGSDTKALEHSVKIWAVLGFLACITFAVASARLGIVCPSCLATYAITSAFAGVALAMLPDPKLPDFGPLAMALPRALAIAIPLHLALLYPASRTPKSTATAMAAQTGPSDAQVEGYFARLTPPEAQAAADARAEWLKATVPDYPVPESHQRYGPADAPVKIVEFTDVLCGHCRALIAMLGELKKAVPPGKISIEPRYFPLDGECNPHGGSPKGDGIRCLGARVQVCLEGRPEYWEVRDSLFENQRDLSKEKIYELATAKGMAKDALDACVLDPKTDARIRADIEWAMAYGIDGTPMVLVNGKQTLGMGPFLYGMAMSGGDANAKYFSKLPPPR